MKINLSERLAQHTLPKNVIAETIGVSRQTLHSIETGKYCPSVLIALKLANLLGVRVEEIFILEKKDL